MMGREDKKKNEADILRGQIRTQTKKKKKKNRKIRKRKSKRRREMRGYMKRAGSIHAYTYSSWSQKSAAGGGARRPRGGGGLGMAG